MNREPVTKKEEPRTKNEKGFRSQLVRGGIGSLIAKSAAILSAFLVSIVLARLLGPEGFGIYSYAFALVTILSIPAQFGLPNLVVRETAKAHANREWGTMRGIWRWTNLAATSFALILVAIGGLLAWILREHYSTTQLTTFLWGLAVVPFIAVGNLRGAALRGLRRVVAGQLPEFVLRPFFLILFVLGYGLFWSWDSLTPGMAMALHALAAGLAFSIGAWLLYQARPVELRDRSEPVYHKKEWMAAAMPLAFVAGMQLINQHTDILILGLFRPADEVGIYRVVVQGGMLVVFGLQAVNMVVAPHFARLHTTGETAQLQRMATLSARASLLMALPVALLYFIWGSVVLRLIFGPEFAQGHTALMIIAVGQLANAGVGSVGFLLNMTGHERDTARGVGIAAGCNVILNFLLIPSMGMNGAAVATAISLLVWNFLLLRAVSVRLGIKSMPWLSKAEIGN